MPKLSLKKERLLYYITYNWGDKVVHDFPENICPKRNIIEQLEFELAYYDVTATTPQRLPPPWT